jgi:hypothetical protein
VAQGGVGEAGADVPGVRELVVLVVDGGQQRADGAGAPTLAGFPPDDQYFLDLRRPDLLARTSFARALTVTRWS